MGYLSGKKEEAKEVVNETAEAAKQKGRGAMDYAMETGDAAKNKTLEKKEEVKQIIHHGLLTIQCTISSYPVNPVYKAGFRSSKSRLYPQFEIPGSATALLGPSPFTLMKMGAISWSVVVKQHQVWRLFTSIWLHSGVVHLLVNMVCLFFIGIRLEQQFGFWRIGIIYLISGIGGNMASCLFYPNHISVGPTSALLGLIGSMFAELLTNMIYYTNKVIAGLTLLLMLVINLVISIVPHPHNGGPIAGFIVGILLGFILLPRPNIGWYPYDHDSKPKFKRHQYVLGIVSLVLLVIGFILGLIMMFRT